MSKDAAARLSPGQRFLAALFPIGVLALAGAAPARAEYPERLIHAIVPFATGGTNDITARLISPYLSKALGQNVVVENKPGASGNIGLEATAKSAPDGYTILFVATGATQNPALYRNLRFDPINDILPVAAIAESPYAIVVNRSLPVKRLSEFINLARQHPGKLNASAGGIGTRLSVELFKIHANVKAEIIPYHGTGASALAVATGETDFAITDTSAFMAYIPSGRVKLLAVAGEKRLPSFPDVPTTAEAGLPTFRAGTTVAVYVPGKAPADIVQKLNTTINTVLVMPEVKEQLNKLGANPAPRSVAEVNQWYRREVQTWKDIVKRLNIPPLD
ncbi:MAG: tripartite tricarboxylate transporter substrate binding protein [Pseudomonadota bacterium]